MQTKITSVLPALLAAANAIMLEQSNGEWFEYRNLLDTDDNGAIDDGALGNELRGRESQEEWQEDFEAAGWLGALDLTKNEQYIFIQSLFRDLGGFDD